MKITLRAAEFDVYLIKTVYRIAEIPRGHEFTATLNMFAMDSCNANGIGGRAFVLVNGVRDTTGYDNTYAISSPYLEVPDGEMGERQLILWLCNLRDIIKNNFVISPFVVSRIRRMLSPRSAIIRRAVYRVISQTQLERVYVEPGINTQNLERYCRVW